MALDQLFSKPIPAVSKRGVHLDLKGVPPTPERLLSLLDLFAAARYNVVLAEWEDSFPWTVDKRFRSPTAYTPEDIIAFRDKAAVLGIEIIPLVQCLGHMETPLSVAGNEHLREDPDYESCLNPLAPGARELIQTMVDDVLRLLPDVKHFHLGGDEAWLFGKHPETAAYIEEHGKGALYLHHVEPILDSLNSQGIRPILWHDMMNSWESDALHGLAAKCDLMPWGYQGHPDTTGDHFNSDYIKRFSEHGFALWGGTAYKGAEGYDADVPDIQLHTENAVGWVEVGARFDFKGVIATAWSRYAVDTVQCNPIDSSLDSLLNVAVILHDGQPHPDGVDACVNALDEVGERERFEACRDVMNRLATIKRRGWEHIQQARQVLALAQIQPWRTSAGNPKMGLKAFSELQKRVGEADDLEADMKIAFDGLIPDIWVDEYIVTRLQPLKDELADIGKKFNALNN